MFVSSFYLLSFDRCEIQEQSLKILLEVGPPMYLGFLIHVFLHFVIIQTKIGKRPLPETDFEPLYSSYGTYGSRAPSPESSDTEYVDAEAGLV